MQGHIAPTTAQVWEWLAAVPDPEIPVLSVVDLGIVRDVSWVDETVGPACVVTITPTYSGCPATAAIAESIKEALRARGVPRVLLKTRISPPWTTDWLSDSAKGKLAAYGIAPPAQQVIDISGIRHRSLPAPRIDCPRCGSKRVRLTSQFGSTPCKALYRCDDCLEPFDYFKCH